MWCLSPEQVALRIASLAAADKSGNQPDDDYELDGQASDKFSLGLVMYEFLTYRYPFPMLMTQEEFYHEVQYDYLQQLRRQAAAFRDWEVSSSASARICSRTITKAWSKASQRLFPSTAVTQS